MKTLKNFLLLLTAVLFVVSCDEREFDMPPINVPTTTIEANTTIQELKEKYAGESLIQIDTAIIIRGLVVANDISGNIYKQILLQDETGGICVAIDRNNIYGDFRIGQEVFIECEGLYFGLYGGYPQLGFQYVNNSGNLAIGQAPWEFFMERAHLNGWPQPDLVISDTLSIENVNETYIGKLVTVTNVTFANTGKPFSTPGPNNAVQTTNEILNSANANSTKTLTARNSSAANFSSNLMPQGVGSVTGVLSVFNGTLQITFRDSLDCSPTRFSVGEGNGTQLLPWSIEYALNNQTGDVSGWIKGYIVGSVVPGINESNPIKGNEDIIFSGDFTNNTVVLAVSPDIKDWQQCVVVNLPAGSDIRSQVNLMDNPDNLGKILNVSGALQNLLGAAGLTTNGTQSEFVFEGTNPGGNGSGSESDPFNVTGAQSNQNNQSAWVKGYIVGGIIDDNNTTSAIDGPEDVIFGANVRPTAVLIANSKTETDYTKCVVVNLPSGAIRNAVNLKDNPTNLGKELTVQGVLRTYFGIAGVRDLTAHKLAGGTTEPPTDAILNETLLTQASFDKFTAVSVSGEQVWNFSAQYGAMMPGFANNASHTNEDWFISPAMNLTGKSNVTLTFDHARGPAGSMNVSTSNYTLWISTGYTSGAPSTATWVQLAIPTHGTTAWTFIPSGNIQIPADKLSANTRFAFKYVCNSTESATWEIKNVLVK